MKEKHKMKRLLFSLPWLKNFREGCFQFSFGSCRDMGVLRFIGQNRSLHLNPLLLLSLSSRLAVPQLLVITMRLNKKASLSFRHMNLVNLSMREPKCQNLALEKSFILSPSRALQLSYFKSSDKKCTDPLRLEFRILTVNFD